MRIQCKSNSIWILRLIYSAKNSIWIFGYLRWVCCKKKMAEIFRMTLYCRVQKITAVKLGTYKSPVRTGTNFPIENLVCVWLSLLKPSGISGSGLLFAWCLPYEFTSTCRVQYVVLPYLRLQALSTVSLIYLGYGPSILVHLLGLIAY